MDSRPAKEIVVQVQIQDLLNDPQLFPIPGESPSPGEIKKRLLQHYHTSKGKLEISIQGEMVVLRWHSDYIDESAEALHRSAFQLAKARQWNEAILKWKQAITINAYDPEYHYHLGLLYYTLKDYTTSAQFLEQTVQIAPIHFKAHLALGICYLKLKKYAEAERHVFESLRLNKQNSKAHLNLGMIYIAQKRYNHAIETFNKTLQLNPSEIRAYFGLAKIYEELNDPEAANGYYQKVIDLAPNTPLAKLARNSIKPIRAETQGDYFTPEKRIEQIVKAIGFFLLGQVSLSCDLFKEYLKAKPSDDYVWYWLGEAQLRCHRIPEAIDCFRRALRLNPQKALYLKSLGVALYIESQYQEASEYLKKATEIEKNDPLTVTLLANCLAQLQKQDEAALLFKQTLKRNPNNPLAMYHYARLLIQTNQKKKAAELLSKINSMEYYAPIKEKSKRLLESL